MKRGVASPIDFLCDRSLFKETLQDAGTLHLGHTKLILCFSDRQNSDMTRQGGTEKEKKT